MVLDRFENHTFGGNWIVGIRIALFGQIFVHSASSTRNPGEFQVRLEPKSVRLKLLKNEQLVYEELDKLDDQSKLGFLYYHDYFKEKRFNAIVLQSTGFSLETLFKQFHKFSRKTINMIAIQCINRLEVLHEAGYVHCSVSPETISTTHNQRQNGNLVLHSFEHSRKILDGKEYSYPCGNEDMLFTSANVQLGIRNFRRDDLISLSYVLIYLMNVALPWREYSSIFQGKKTRKAVIASKNDWKVESLSKSCPAHFLRFMRDVLNLEPEKRPLYRQLAACFEEAMQEDGDNFDYRFDWCCE